MTQPYFDSGSIINCSGTSSSPIANITIKGLNLIGNKSNGGLMGIYCGWVGKGYSSGLTSGSLLKI